MRRRRIAVLTVAVFAVALTAAGTVASADECVEAKAGDTVAKVCDGKATAKAGDAEATAE